MKRMPVNQRKSRRTFTRTANKTHVKNVLANPQRGGRRL